ncbi:MAG TPA: Crp/Fnr family transcriptional regulator, partial [Peptococcaceae bacterium]|nr:Crp/Fnr family transcriptional regulator [Peptococcaceae bacterium]
MEKKTEISVKSMLFDRIDAMDMKSLLSCLGAKRVKKTTGDILWDAGDKVTAIGLILSGRLQIIREDAAGNRAIIAELNSGELFGESFV